MSTIRSSVRHLAGALACLVTLAAPAAAQVLAQAANVHTPWTAPASEARTRNPVLPTMAQVEFGRELYQRECESCHGHTGRGDGMQSGALVTPIADLVSARVQGQTDGALFWKVSEGRGEMPAAKTALSEAERWAIVIYVRTLPTKR